MTEAELPVPNCAEFLKPRLRLFLSVDLVGSTAFKQADAVVEGDKIPGPGIGAPWLSPISKFYRNFEREFSRRWEHYQITLAKKAGWPAAEPPELWKCNGDELLYTKSLSDHREAFACVSAWITALKSFRSELRKTNSLLDVKSTAWLAGFPIRNMEVIFRASVGINTTEIDEGDPLISGFKLLDRWYERDKGRSELVRDFVGPSIDTGFRLSALASPRQFMVSVELALMLVCITPPLKELSLFTIMYDGRKELKGILGNRPYPVFWIDLGSEDVIFRAEDVLSGLQKCSPQDIRNFCEEFIRQNSRYFIWPFIYGNHDILFGQPPEGYWESLKEYNEKWINERNKSETEEKAVGGETPTEIGPEEVVPDEDIKKITDMLP